MADMSGTHQDAITQVSSKSLHWQASYGVSNIFNITAVRHVELDFYHSGPPTKSTMQFAYSVKIWYRSDLRCRRYAILLFCQFG